MRLGALGQRQRHGLCFTSACEAAHTDSHPILNETGGLFGADDPLQQGRIADTLFKHALLHDLHSRWHDIKLAISLATMACSFTDETDIDQGRDRDHGLSPSNLAQETASGASALQAAGSSRHRRLANRRASVASYRRRNMMRRATAPSYRQKSPVIRGLYRWVPDRGQPAPLLHHRRADQMHLS